MDINKKIAENWLKEHGWINQTPAPACEHCFCQKVEVYDKRGYLIWHKQCCNCGIKKIIESWSTY